MQSSHVQRKQYKSFNIEDLALLAPHIDSPIDVDNITLVPMAYASCCTRK